MSAGRSACAIRFPMAYTVPKLEDYSKTTLESEEGRLYDALAEEAAAVRDEPQWKQFRDRWIGRKNGILTQINDVWLKSAPSPSKKDAGLILNRIKKSVEARVDATLTFVLSPTSEVGHSIDIPTTAWDRFTEDFKKVRLERERIDI